MNNDTITTTEVTAKIVAIDFDVADNRNGLAARLKLTGDRDLSAKLSLIERKETINYTDGPVTIVTRWFKVGDTRSKLRAIAKEVRTKLADQIAAGQFEVVKGEEGYDLGRLAEVVRAAYVEAEIADLAQDRIPFIRVNLWANYKREEIRLDDRVLVYEDNVRASLRVAYEGSEATRA